MSQCAKNEYPYSEIKNYINEGDVLLFRGQGWMSKLISASSGTPYTHVGVASWVNGNANTDKGILECVEFREGSLIAGLLGMSGGGGRSVNLQQEVKKRSGRIDVYRPHPFYFKYKFNSEKKEFIFSKITFDGKAVTTIMREMTGLPYGWRRIWWMFKHKILSYSLTADQNTLICDNLNDIIYPVCSTAFSYAFNSTGYDVVKNRSDEWTEPGDIAKSTMLTYFATLIDG